VNEQPTIRRRPPRISLADLQAPNQDLIHLSLAAIARSLPPGLAGESLKALPESVRVTFPFEWIEPQLARGSVELPRDRFFEALPSGVRSDFNLAENASVALPLDEILQNLPGRHPRGTVPAPALSDEVRAESAPSRRTGGDQSVLQSIFMTEDDLDLDKIAGLLCALPGLEGCVAASGGQVAVSGEIPKDFRSGDIHTISSELFHSAGEYSARLGLGKLRSSTLQCDGSLASFFVREHVSLCVFHRGCRGFLPGVREKLDAVAGQMAGSF